MDLLVLLDLLVLFDLFSFSVTEPNTDLLNSSSSSSVDNSVLDLEFDERIVENGNDLFFLIDP